MMNKRGSIGIFLMILVQLLCSDSRKVEADRTDHSDKSVKTKKSFSDVFNTLTKLHNNSKRILNYSNPGKIMLTEGFK